MLRVEERPCPGQRSSRSAATPSPAGQAGTYEEQSRQRPGDGAAVCALRDAGWRVVVVHGNGPQVGNLAIQQDEARPGARPPAVPLGAMTQGQLGSLLAWR